MLLLLAFATTGGWLLMAARCSVLVKEPKIGVSIDRWHHPSAQSSHCSRHCSLAILPAHYAIYDKHIAGRRENRAEKLSEEQT